MKRNSFARSELYGVSGFRNDVSDVVSMSVPSLKYDAIACVSKSSQASSRIRLSMTRVVPQYTSAGKGRRA